MSNYTDAADTIRDLECAIIDLRQTDLEDVGEALNNLRSKFNNHECEFNYMSDDCEELERWRECGFDVEDIEGMEDEIKDLTEDLKTVKAEVEHVYEKIDNSPELVNLRVRNNTQRKIIMACFEHIRELHSETDESIISRLVAAGNVPDLPRIDGPAGQGHA